MPPRRGPRASKPAAPTPPAPRPPPDLALPVFLGLKALAAEAVIRDKELAAKALHVAEMATAVLQGLRYGVDLVSAKEVAILSEAAQDLRGKIPAKWKRTLESAPRGRSDYEVVVSTLLQLDGVLGDGHPHRGKLLALAMPERVQESAALLRTVAVRPKDNLGLSRKRASVPSKRGKEAGQGLVRQWESVMVELLIRAGIEPATMTKAERKRYAETLAYHAR